MILLFYPQNYSLCHLIESVFKDEESMQQTLWCFLAVPWLNHLIETILPNSCTCICPLPYYTARPHSLNQNPTREGQSFMWGTCVNVISGLICDPPCLVCHCLVPHFCFVLFLETRRQRKVFLKVLHKIKLTNIPVGYGMDSWVLSPAEELPTGDGFSGRQSL